MQIFICLAALFMTMSIIVFVIGIFLKAYRLGDPGNLDDTIPLEEQGADSLYIEHNTKVLGKNKKPLQKG